MKIAVFDQSLKLVHICSLVQHIDLHFFFVKGQITRSRIKSRSNIEIVIFGNDLSVMIVIMVVSQANDVSY